MRVQQTRVVAWVVLVALTVGAGCGDNRLLPEFDAPVVIDAHVRVTGEVTAHTYLAGPVAGDTVIFQHVDGTVAAIRKTDEHGAARAEVEVGGNVTVIHEAADGSAEYATTFVGVEPGDDVWQGRRGASYEEEYVEAILPPRFNGASLRTSCHEGSSYGGPVRWPRDCEKLSAMVQGEKSDGGQEFAFLPPTAKPANGKLDLTGLDFRPLTPVAVRLRNIPPEIRSVNGSWNATNGIYHLRKSQSAVATAPVAGESMLTGNMPQLPGLFLVAIVDVSDGSYSSGVSLSLTEGQQDVDVSAAVMPAITSVPVLDAYRRNVQWTETSWGHAAGVVADMKLSDHVYRSVMAPHRGPALDVPQLPDPYDRFNVHNTGVAILEVYLMTDSDGYRGVRNWISRSGGYFSVHQPGGFFGNWFYN